MVLFMGISNKYALQQRFTLNIQLIYILSFSSYPNSLSVSFFLSPLFFLSDLIKGLSMEVVQEHKKQGSATMMGVCYREAACNQDGKMMGRSHHVVVDDDDDDTYISDHDSSSSTSYNDGSPISKDSSSSSSELLDDASSSSSSSSPPSGGPLYELSELMNQLPIKRGLSKYYQGKSQSFTSLARVTSLEDLAKKEKTPYRRKLKACRSYGGGLNNCRSYIQPKPTISKKNSKASPSNLSCLSRKSSFMGSPKPPLCSLQSSF